MLGSAREPHPGYEDNFLIGNVVTAQMITGILRFYPFKENCVMDVVPVDVVAHQIIAGAWHSSAYPSGTIRIYNSTINSINDITWEAFFDLSMAFAKKYPTEKMIWYPGYCKLSNTYTEWYYKYFVHRPMAFFLDLYSIVAGNRARLVTPSHLLKLRKPTLWVVGTTAPIPTHPSHFNIYN